MTSSALLRLARELRCAVAPLAFSAPVAHVYNPLDYAWPVHKAFVERFGNGPKRVVFIGMNPGPYGMMQVGVPFGEIAAVRDWMGLSGTVTPPALMHPKRPIEGFACQRSEVSGRRLWGWAAARFGTAEAFFAECFVLNYCPLAFLAESGSNLTPDKLPAGEVAPLLAACDQHLAAALAVLGPEWVIGLGGYARARIEQVLGAISTPRIGQILHPSPASPAANRGWAEAVDRRLAELGVFDQ